MTGTPLIVGPKERAALAALREKAAAAPVNIPWLLEAIKTRDGKAKHMRQMTAQTVRIPIGYLVTFSIEIEQPAGTCRHMSMSSPNPDRLPRPEALWMVAVELGFVGSIETCAVWRETLTQGEAINLVQPIATAAETTA